MTKSTFVKKAEPKEHSNNQSTPMISIKLALLKLAIALLAGSAILALL